MTDIALNDEDEWAGKALLILARHWGLDPEDALSRAIDEALARDGYADRPRRGSDAAFTMRLRSRLAEYASSCVDR